MGHEFGGEPRLMIRAGGVAWVNAFIVVMLAIELVLLVGLLVTDLMPIWGALLLLGTLAAVGLLIWAILPRQFEVYDDRLVLVFPLWRWDIGIDSIEVVRDATALQAYAYNGIRFASLPGRSVEVKRRDSSIFRRPSIIISPEDRRLFVTEMNAAMNRYRRLQPNI
jgi:hypothetical protein